ncbi:E3 ubiquitin-protein ligase BRE1A-like isoform X2 [Lingula anatina]|uniref:E3 ubiquitin protein ligase n=1 Tax=Lingula anatina TaxID=7574 RepID=A0A1S3GZF2_LINAN|nr:E3 ubiquitin-protein ligase BRE1A isoform X2 [Lingula anatina]XP_013422070.1 E3 ubiquitin-protein ligase BRE1A-like isoform X2 [Lingula anatina]|eukprot:XP_013378606.1 E3 ubiquitin-protein ligase BRE1A isoform X2 [Lingula anatina]
MSAKRPLSESPTGSTGPPSKKALVQFEPIKIGPIYSLEELDLKTVQFQNKKLSQRLEQRRRAEEDLRKRIEQLEKRQTTDDAVLCIVNRYWNQLDEDVRVLLERFDAETADEDERENQSEAVTSFLTQLSSWDKEELEQNLSQRVEFSKRAIGKLIQAYDRLLQRNEKLYHSIKDLKIEKDGDAQKADMKEELKTETTERAGEDDSKSSAQKETEDQEGEKEGSVEKQDEEKPEKKNGEQILSEAVKTELLDLQKENKRLQNLVTKLQEIHHVTTLKHSDLQEKFTAAETEIAELKNKIDDLEYDLGNTTHSAQRFEFQLYEAAQKLKSQTEVVTVEGEGGGGVEGVSKSKFQELTSELEEQRELASTRLQELENLQKNHQDTVKEEERLKMELKELPESVIVETSEYKSLQSQFSVLYNECMQIRTQLDESRNLLQSSKNAHLRQIEQMESDELACQKKLRTEMIQLEDTLAQVRKEYEMLRIEFEQTLAANEQTGPINREMRNLITSLQNHNHQLKGEVARYKRKLKEAQTEIAKFKAEASSADQPLEEPPKEPSPPRQEEPIIIKKEEEEKMEKEREKGKSDSEIIKDLKQQLKKAQDSQKEMKLLLDMYKSAPKEQRDKVQLMAGEKKAKQDIDELKNHIRKMQEAERKEKRKLAEDEAIRKIKRLEESIADLQRNLAAQKQEEEALLNEMEVTGQAFEDMQEQNIRLIQQLREKDDANFKLMSERIKSNQIHKLLKEEKDVLMEQVTTLHQQVETQNLVVRRLEEKERILQNNLATVEKELSLRQQALEMHKRKAVESSQTAADLRLHLEKYQNQLKDAQITVAEKTGAMEQESFKYRRIQEDVAILRRKLERHKKIELAGTADAVLMEELKEYKEQLTCPSCKVKRKDAVLTKCFHVFCLECLKTRYETRQRKCPKCNAGFGANDFHRIYLD